MLGLVIVFILLNVLIIISLFLFDIFGLRRNLSICGLNDRSWENTAEEENVFVEGNVWFFFVSVSVFYFFVLLLTQM